MNLPPATAPTPAPRPSLLADGRAVGLVGLVVAAWAVLPRYAGPALDTSDRVEVADHVVPGVVVAVASVAVLAGRWRRGTGPVFGAGLVVVLAGSWMTATHGPLLAQAARDEVGWGAAAFHTAPGLAVLGAGLAWVAWHWRDGDGGGYGDTAAAGSDRTGGDPMKRGPAVM